MSPELHQLHPAECYCGVCDFSSPQYQDEVHRAAINLVDPDSASQMDLRWRFHVAPV